MIRESHRWYPVLTPRKRKLRIPECPLGWKHTSVSCRERGTFPFSSQCYGHGLVPPPPGGAYTGRVAAVSCCWVVRSLAQVASWKVGCHSQRDAAPERPRLVSTRMRHQKNKLGFGILLASCLATGLLPLACLWTL